MRRGRGRGIYWGGRWARRGYFSLPFWNRGIFPYRGGGLGYRYWRAGYNGPIYPGRWWRISGYGFRPPNAWVYPIYAYPRAGYQGYRYW
jgi:hypothetical protein